MYFDIYWSLFFPPNFDAVITSVENFFRLADPLSEYNLTQSEYDQFLDLLFSEAIASNKRQKIQILENNVDYISASMVLTNWPATANSAASFSTTERLLQKFAAGISSEHHVFLFCEKIYCILLKKEDLDDKFLKKQVQRLLWKFNPGLEICAGIYHSDHDWHA